jgi:hypothetical protein
MIFKTAAFQQLGKTLNPMTGKVEKNLEQARFSIDMIEMLKDKTRGNLPEELDKLLDSTLLELRMNYVEEANAEAGAGDSAKAGDSGDAGAGGSETGQTGSGTGKGEPGPEEPGPDKADSDAAGTGSEPGTPEAAEKPEGADSGGAGSKDDRKGPQGD